MLGGLQGCTALVTGASSGLGRELARLLAARARALVLTSRREGRIAALASELRQRHPQLVVVTLPCDLCDVDARARMLSAAVDAVGPIDVLINDAGFGDYRPLWSADWAKLSKMIQLNVDAHAWLTWSLLPAMRRRGQGRILAVASGMAVQPFPGFAVYAGTRAFVRAMTDALQMELAGTGVWATLCLPGPMRTEFEEVTGPFAGDYLPAFMDRDPGPVAREALRALERGRPVVVPGWTTRLSLVLARLTPAWLARVVFAARFRAAQRRRALRRPPASPGELPAPASSSEPAAF